MRRIVVVVALGLLALGLIAGCSSREGTSDAVQQRPLTEAQRDSLIARSPLPGASVVGRSLAARDSASARAARLSTTTN